VRKLITSFSAAALLLGAIAAGMTVDPQGGERRAEADNVQVASTPISTTENVTPYTLHTTDGTNIGPGGNVACTQIGVFDYASDRTDYDPADPRINFTVLLYDAANTSVGTVTVAYSTTTRTLDFDATIPIEAVIVKGGSGANIYDYRIDAAMADTGLGAPPNSSGASSDLGNLTMCSNPAEDPPPSNWCSPGYWRNHLAAIEATGISSSAPYTTYFDASTLSKKASNQNPTLAQVLAAPQTFGGQAFNNVGDLLSEAHPGVNWSVGQDRTEDSCPLS
jgi:hypothetical protein